MQDGGVKHARQPHVDRIDRLRGHLVEHVKAPARLARELPRVRLLQLDRSRGRELGRVRGDGAEGHRAAGRPVDDRTHVRDAFRRRHIPTRRGRGDQHVAGDGAGLPQVKLRRRDGTAGAGRQIAPDAVAAPILLGSDEFGADFGPIAFQLLGDQHGEAGLRALPHLGPRDADDDRVVRGNHQPGRDLRGFLGRARQCERDGKGQRQAAARSTYPFEEGTAAQRVARHCCSLAFMLGGEGGGSIENIVTCA